LGFSTSVPPLSFVTAGGYCEEARAAMLSKELLVDLVQLTELTAIGSSISV
jgi:hypothetical protein